MRVWLGLLASALAAATVVGATARATSVAPARTVPCQEIIGHPAFPFAGFRGFRYRVVLGVVSAPPRFLGQPVALHEGPWPYWLKVALVIEAGAPSVSISVSERWKKRVAIIWGNGNYDAGSSIQIAGSCGTIDTGVGNAYAGGFYFRSRTACVPLVFRVGGRSATVRFGIDRRCRQGLRARSKRIRPPGVRDLRGALTNTGAGESLEPPRQRHP
jgi:hypothetical protein